MRKNKHSNKSKNTENFEDFVFKMSLSLLIDEKTKSIVVPYLETMSLDEAIACLRCLAGLLIVDDDEREKICKETLGEQADFIMMIVRELDRIISEELGE